MAAPHSARARAAADPSAASQRNRATRAMTPDQERLAVILQRLRDFERHVPLSHERAALEVAKQTLREEARRLAHRLGDLDYLRPRWLGAGP